jgi:hypothetical protein
MLAEQVEAFPVRPNAMEFGGKADGAGEGSQNQSDGEGAGGAVKHLVSPRSDARSMRPPRASGPWRKPEEF